MIDRGERVPFWQIWLLRLRASTGWGKDVSELRQWSRAYAIFAKMWALAGPTFAAGFFFAFIFLPHFGINGHHPEPWPSFLRSLVPLIVVCVVITITATWYSVAHWRRANAGAQAQSTSIYGYCYTSAIAPTQDLFALIGPTRQSAQWFRLPIDWDTTVELSRDRFGLTYNPATGFVSKLNRFGAQPQTLPDTAEVAEIYGPNDALPGDPTTEQQYEMLQMASSEGMYWGYSIGSMKAQVIALSLVSAGFVIFMMTFVIPTLSPLRYNKPSNIYAIILVVTILGASSVASTLFAVYTLRVWQSFQRSEALGPASVDGDLIRFTRRGSQSNWSSVWLALITRADDGEQILLCVPRKLQHRLWGGPGRVRVVYNPASGRVLDLRHSTEPVVERD